MVLIVGQFLASSVDSLWQLNNSEFLCVRTVVSVIISISKQNVENDYVQSVQNSEKHPHLLLYIHKL